MTNTSNTPGYRIPDDQFRSVGISPEDSVGVLHVVTESRDLQVLKPIISFDPVFVIDGHLGRNPDESISNQSVSVAAIELPIAAKDDHLVPVLFIGVAPDNTLLMALISSQALESAHIADLVKGESLNRFPLLHTSNPTMEYM